jgi:hypothetical protein
MKIDFSMTILRPLLICGIATFSLALTIGVPVTAPKRGPRPFLTGEPQMLGLLKMRNYPANIEIVESLDGERVSVSRRPQIDDGSDAAGPRAMDTFIVQ